MTPQVAVFAQEFKTKDRMVLYKHYHFDKIFGRDPSPGKPKVLRVRYRMLGVFGMLSIDVLPDNKIPARVILLGEEKTKDLRIVAATWGHPRGRSTTGRMSVDVREVLQGLVDLNGGSYLFIGSLTNILTLLGDPCPGYKKDLQISYDISGRSDSVMYEETKGFLRKKHIIETCPIVKPMIFVERASYGITWRGKREHLLDLQKKIRKISSINHRKSMGMLPTLEENQLVSKLASYKVQIAEFQTVEPTFVDVTKKMKTLVDLQGGMSFVLDRHKFDPNNVFGNPCEHGMKLLEVELICTGHDSENTTDKREMTLEGYPRNVIPGKNGRYVIACWDLDPDEERHRIGKHLQHEERRKRKALRALARAGMESKESNMVSLNMHQASAGRQIELEQIFSSRMDEDLRFETFNGAPMVSISKATYGHRGDLMKNYSVNNQIQNMVVGRQLILDNKTYLN